MKPHIGVARDNRQRREVIDRTRVGGAGICYEEERFHASFLIYRNSLFQCSHVYSEIVIAVDLAYVLARGFTLASFPAKMVAMRPAFVSIRRHQTVFSMDSANIAPRRTPHWSRYAAKSSRRCRHHLLLVCVEQSIVLVQANSRFQFAFSGTSIAERGVGGR